MPRGRKTSTAPHFVSLFSGCGGLDNGFIQAGFRCLAAFDIDPWAVATHNKNLGANARQVDLVQATYREMPTCGVDVVVAGPPCQGFSIANWRSGPDPRNKLLTLPVAYAIEVGARAVVIENVPTAASAMHSKYWKLAERRLRNAGYHVQRLLLNAHDFGLPQVRWRLFLLAVRSSLTLSAPVLPIKPAISMRQALDIPNSVANHNPVPLAPHSRTARIAARIGLGQKLCNVRAGESAVHTWNIPEVFGAVTSTERQFLDHFILLRRRERARDWGDADPVDARRLKRAYGTNWAQITHSLLQKHYLRRMPGGRYDLRHTFNGKYRRLDLHRPANCVLTKFCEPEYFLHPLEDRAFSVREAARLQGFSDSFCFLGPDNAQAVQVGNAVPPPVSHAIAKGLLGML